MLLARATSIVLPGDAIQEAKTEKQWTEADCWRRGEFANRFQRIRNAQNLPRIKSNSQDEGIVAGHLADGIEEQTIQGSTNSVLSYIVILIPLVFPERLQADRWYRMHILWVQRLENLPEFEPFVRKSWRPGPEIRRWDVGDLAVIRFVSPWPSEVLRLGATWRTTTKPSRTATEHAL